MWKKLKIQEYFIFNAFSFCFVFKRKLDENTQKQTLAANAKQDFNNSVTELLARQDINDVVESHKMRENFNKNERFIWHVTIDNTKSSIETLFNVADYREATVNGKKIFKDLNYNSMNETSILIDSNNKNTKNVVRAACRLAEDAQCKMKVNNARDFNNLMNAIKQVGVDLTNINHDDMLTQVNEMYNSASEALLNDSKMQFTSINSAAVHAYKHKEEFGPHTTTKDYLTKIRDTLIKPVNAGSVKVYTQDGKALCTNYYSTENNRYRFGVVRTDVQTNKSYVTTMYVTGTVQNPPANPNPAPPQDDSQGGFMSGMSWLPLFFDDHENILF